MNNGFRPKLGLGLQNIVDGDQPPINIAQQPDLGPVAPSIPQSGGFFGQGGMGRYIAGAIGDTLLQNAGMQPVFAPMQRDRQRAELEDVHWSRRQAQDRADKQWEWANKPVADDMFARTLEASGIQRGSPEWVQAMKRRVETLTDPDVTTTLPNGQFYSGPRSGLARALMGQTAPTQTPTAPVGKLTPIPGGGAGNGVGGFHIPSGSPLDPYGR